MRGDLDQNYFRRLLLDRQESIRNSQTGRSPITELDHAKVGRLSRMDAMQQKEMSKAAFRLAELELQRIETALARILSGDYGYCISCDEEIPEGRLSVDPSALVCINCARAAEK